MKISLPYAPFQPREHAIRTSNMIVGFLTLEFALENIENDSVVAENGPNDCRGLHPIVLDRRRAYGRYILMIVGSVGFGNYPIQIEQSVRSVYDKCASDDPCEHFTLGMEK